MKVKEGAPVGNQNARKSIKKKLITFRISPVVIERLKSEKNQSQLVEYLLIEYFERNEK